MATKITNVSKRNVRIGTNSVKPKGSVTIEQPTKAEWETIEKLLKAKGATIETVATPESEADFLVRQAQQGTGAVPGVTVTQ